MFIVYTEEGNPMLTTLSQILLFCVLWNLWANRMQYLILFKVNINELLKTNSEFDIKPNGIKCHNKTSIEDSSLNQYKPRRILADTAVREESESRPKTSNKSWSDVFISRKESPTEYKDYGNSQCVGSACFRSPSDSKYKRQSASPAIGSSRYRASSSKRESAKNSYSTLE